MSATDDRRTSRATPGAARTGGREEHRLAFSPADVHGARLLVADVRIRSLLAREARRRGLTRMFGVPRADQSFLVTMILLAAAVTVLRRVVTRPLPHPSGGDAAIGGFALIGALRGLAGPPARSVPFASVLIAFALLAHAFRFAVARSVRGARGGGARFAARYGARSVECAHPDAPSPSGQGR